MGGVLVASIFAREFLRTSAAATASRKCIARAFATAPKSPSNFKDPLAAAVALDATILARWRASREPSYRFSIVVGIVDELVGLIFDEMDYVAEAASARFAAAYAVDGGAGAGLAGLIRAPRIVPELSTRAVLVMEWIDGARLTDVDALFASGLTSKDAH